MDNFDDEDTMTTKITSLEGLTKFTFTEDGMADSPDGYWLAVDDVRALLASQAEPAELQKLRRRVSELEAARIAYANEFPPTADGDPDVGNIHANIRALKAASAPLSQPHQAVVAAGWKIVPIEPTPGMVEAAFAGAIEDQDINRQIKRRQAMAQNYAAMLAAAPLPPTPTPARPTDDELWDQTIHARETYHEWADKLAEAISKHFGAYIGEHSNTNCPWAEALEAIKGATRPLPVGQALDLAAPMLTDEQIRGLAFGLYHSDYQDDPHGYDIELARRVERALRSAPGNPAAPDQAHLPGWERGIATVTINGHQLREALEFINPGGDDEPDELDNDLTFGIVKHADEHGEATTGLCCWNDDTDGVLPLDGAPVNPVSENGDKQ